MKVRDFSRLGTRLALLLCGVLFASQVTAQRLVWLGTLPGGFESRANALSADGSVVVGMSWVGQFQTRAVRWTPARGLVDLGIGGAEDSR
ncbi:MAG: hypothetical protein C4335_10200 [Armatimonadota bacterium]